MDEVACQTIQRKGPWKVEEVLASFRLYEYFPVNATAWVNCIKIKFTFKLNLSKMIHSFANTRALGLQQRGHFV